MEPKNLYSLMICWGMKYMHFALFWGMFLFAACQQDRQSTSPPTIELLSALGAFDVQIPDTVSFQVRIRSDQVLNRAVLRVQRQDGVALLPPIVRFLSNQDTTLAWTLALTDSMLPSGQFQLVLQAFSGDQTRSLFIPLLIRPVPRPFKGVVWFTRSGTLAAVQRCDSQGIMAPLESHLAFDLIQATSAPGLREVWLRGRTSATLWRFHLDSSLTRPVYNTAFDPGQSPFTFLSSSNQGIYASRGLGDILRFSHSGALGGQFLIPADFVPVFNRREQEQLLVELRARPPSSIRRIRIYHADFQGILREFTVGGNILGAARIANDAWVLLIEQQNTGIGRIWRYQLTSQQLQEESPSNIEHRFKAIVPGRDGYWLAGVSGIWNFQPALDVQNGAWQRRFQDEVSDLHFDAQFSRLVGWNGTSGYIWNPDVGGRIECQLPDSIRFACPY